ncbi:MAG: CRISPR-associated protein Cas4 [Desulfatitalea sp.]
MKSILLFELDEPISISALSHYIFCRRRCALIHIEQLWTENIFTAQGRVMHEHVHKEGMESRGDVRIEHGVPLCSMRLGLSGKSDVIEFHRRPDGLWLPFPVEYKIGKPKPDDCDTVQLCAQALCLEEMLSVTIPAGALFYGKTRRRTNVDFDEPLRRKTQETAFEARKLIESGITSGPEYSPKCEKCSLVNLCLPKIVGERQTIKQYLAKVLDRE